MFRIHFPSFFRAGTIAAVVAGFLLLLALTPFFDNVLLVLLASALLVLPVGAGMYYGYLAPGEETSFQSIVGGALSGAVAGIVLGIAFGLNRFTLSVVSTGLLGYAVVSSFAVAALTGAILGVFGAILGGIGGILWKVVQNQYSAQ